jgi:CRP/FNR family transcriptional regulator, dissimilatory nitrate respiration regulator
LTRLSPSAQSLLAALPLFKSLDKATLERLAGGTTRIALRRGERLFSHGDPLTGMYVLVYGEVRLMARSPRGRRLTGVVPPGASFAEPLMFLDRPAVVDAEAVTDALVLQVSKQCLFDELERNPLFARHIIASLCRRIESLVHEAEHHSIASGRARLVQYLARHARAGQDGALVELPAPKAVVAASLHLTPEHFSRILHELAAEGVIQVKARRIGIPDLERLAAAAAVHPKTTRRAAPSGRTASGHEPQRGRARSAPA